MAMLSLNMDGVLDGKTRKKREERRGEGKSNEGMGGQR